MREQRAVAAILVGDLQAACCHPHFAAAVRQHGAHCVDIDLLRARPAAAAKAGFIDGGGDWRYLGRGFLVDSLNPKIALFFLAFIPQFLSSVQSPGFAVSLALGSVFLVTGAIVNGSLAWLVAAGVDRAGGRFGEWMQRWIPGGVLVYLGLRLLWQDNH